MNANITALLYLVAGVLFILALRGLASPETSRRGNALGIAGMAIAVITTLFIAAPGWGAFALIVVGIRMSGGGAAPVNIGNFLLLTISGVLIIYSLWIVMISLTFWFVKFDNSVTILQALMDSGRYPAQVYPVWLRMLVTFVIPIAVATTVPLQALRGELLWWQVLMFVSIGAASLLISAQVWKAGVRRYSGASS
jgi:ABC-type uncharacterized transport system permease subunit